MSAPFLGVARAFDETARRLGPAPAVVEAGRAVAFGSLADRAEGLARALLDAGLAPGERAALMVPFSADFYALAFALLRARLVPVFIDPGLGLAGVGRCLEEARPAAFIGSPKAHAARLLGGWARSARACWSAGGAFPGIRPLPERGRAALAEPREEEEAAVLFTSGSTGAPKGAVYTQGMFAAQARLLRELFEIREGEVSVPTFPLFGLFDAALGQTCVLPRMDFSRPVRADPAEIVARLQGSGARQLFASPALLARLGDFGRRHGLALPGLSRVLSAGAPVPAAVVRSMARLMPPEGRVFTPYGATEALPVAVIDSREILAETAAAAEEGGGTCVGRPVPGVEVAVIRVVDGAIAAWSESLRAAAGDAGEIAVRGPVVSASYASRPADDAAAKIPSPAGVWHRMGDLGRLDGKGRLWFLGRKSQRVRARGGDIPTEPAERVAGALAGVRRAALVGVGPAGAQEPVLCVEPEPGAREEDLRGRLPGHLRGKGLVAPARILFHPAFPVDARHNAKIGREALAAWAEREAGR